MNTCCVNFSANIAGTRWWCVKTLRNFKARSDKSALLGPSEPNRIFGAVRTAAPGAGPCPPLAFTGPLLGRHRAACCAIIPSRHKPIRWISGRRGAAETIFLSFVAVARHRLQPPPEDTVSALVQFTARAGPVYISRPRKFGDCWLGADPRRFELAKKVKLPFGARPIPREVRVGGIYT
jgi:hypothetical protein